MLIILGDNDQVGLQHVKEEVPPSLTQTIELEHRHRPYEGMNMDLEQRGGGGNEMQEMDTLISLPLFRVTGTTMDIEKLYEKLQGNDQPLREVNSFEQKPRDFGAHWKTRIGRK